MLEEVRVDALDDLAVHLDQPPVRVEREARVRRRRCEAEHGAVVQAEVEDRVHHPGHRDRRARAHRDEQWLERVAEPGSRRALEALDVLADLVVEAGGQLAGAGHVGAAGVGRDREPCGNRHAEMRHLGEPDALASQKLSPSVRRLVERVHQPGPRRRLRDQGFHGSTLLSQGDAQNVPPRPWRRIREAPHAPAAFPCSRSAAAPMPARGARGTIDA
jgi:hypothetical protein